MGERVIYVLEYDFVDSRGIRDRLGVRLQDFLNGVSNKIRQELSVFSPFYGDSVGGDAGFWLFNEPEQAVRAGIRLVDNLPAWSRQASRDDCSACARAAVYKTYWHAQQKPEDYDARRAIGKALIDAHMMPNDCLAVADKVLSASRMAKPEDLTFDYKHWPPNHREPDVRSVGKIRTRLRPGRIRINGRKLEGAMIAAFPNPLSYGELQSSLVTEHAISDNYDVLRAFQALSEHRITEGKKPLYNGQCFRVVGAVDFGLHVTSIPVAQITFANYEVWRKGDAPAVKNRIEENLSTLPFPSKVGVLGPRYPTPIGVEIALITSDRPPRLLLVNKSRHVHLSPAHWDVSFSGYANRNDLTLVADTEVVDFWQTARREAESELSGYRLEMRSLQYSGLHFDIETGAVDLIGHCKVQETHTEFDPYVRWLHKDAGRLPREPELAESDFVWVEASPQAVAEFCRERKCTFGGRRAGRTVLIPEAAAAVVQALRSLGFSENYIQSSLEDVCQDNYE